MSTATHTLPRPRRTAARHSGAHIFRSTWNGRRGPAARTESETGTPTNIAGSALRPDGVKLGRYDMGRLPSA